MNRNKGFTLIEVIIYTVLLSILIGGYIQYVYAMTLENTNLNNEIEKEFAKESGFGALIAVLLLSFGFMVMSLVTVGYSFAFTDIVERKELRFQSSINVESCLDNVELMLKVDPFLVGNVRLREFGCEANIKVIEINTQSQHYIYEVEAISLLEFVRSYSGRRIEI